MFTSLFQTHLIEHQDAISKLSAMSDQIAPLADAWLTALKNTFCSRSISLQVSNPKSTVVDRLHSSVMAPGTPTTDWAIIAYLTSDRHMMWMQLPNACQKLAPPPLKPPGLELLLVLPLGAALALPLTLWPFG